jgi:anti-sigma factor RsiW
MRSTIPSAVSAFFLERGLPFRVEPGTLALPGYQLVGARVHAIGGRPSALAVSRDARNRIVVCQSFEGRVEELPRPDRIFVRGAVRVHLHPSRGANAVFWQDGTLIRSLASDLPAEELLRLAFAQRNQRGHGSFEGIKERG